MSIKDRIKLKRNAKASWKKIKFGEIYNRKSGREAFYDRYFECKWARRTAEKDAYKEVKAASRRGKRAGADAMKEFANKYPTNPKAVRYTEKIEWENVKNQPRGLERKRDIKTYNHEHPKAALKRKTGKALLTMATVAVVAVGVYAAVAKEGNNISSADIKGSAYDEHPVVNTLPDAEYEKAPEEKLPELTEDEKNILGENENHDNGSSVEMNR